MSQVHAPQVVKLTSPGVGHVAPVAELARRLAAHHGFTSTIVTYTNLSSPTNSSALASLPPGVSTTALPEVPIDDLPADAHIVTRILIVVQRTLPHLLALLRSLLDTPAGITVFLTDMLCPAALAVAQDLGVTRYVFYPSSVMSLSMLLDAPELARTTTCEFRDLPEPDRANPVYDLLVDLCLDYLHGDGFIVHTLDAMEYETLEALKDLSDKGVYPPTYAVGPFLRSCSDKSAEHHCMRWLDGQPDGSVLYVCFGSGGTLSSTQTTELAAGLEASGQRFLWVVRLPSDKDSCGSYFGPGDHVDDPLIYLPEGFTERTRGTGLVVPQWAPQVEILGHRAWGGGGAVGWVPVALRVELVAGDGVLGRAGAGMAAIRRAEDERREARARRSGAASERPGGRGGAAGGGGRGDEGADGGREGPIARKKARQLQAEASKASVPDGPAHQALAAVVDMWKCAPSSPAVAAGGL
ncbi:unnamed protein product [Miscanthus lutarioriparius]|uniref:Glycosyltransferase n=1 Tax=Miscanthus lutarioriparius TaxID=422564 RepID=A0A811NK97_9POAL|nr:unnamed protein product [Miscanthus lutarioriparius]